MPFTSLDHNLPLLIVIRTYTILIHDPTSQTPAFHHILPFLPLKLSTNIIVHVQIDKVFPRAKVRLDVVQIIKPYC